MSTSSANNTVPDTRVELHADEAADDGTTPPSGANRLLERGETVSRYVILGVLGQGGMGVVYGAFDPELERKVALKLMYRPQHDDKRKRRKKRQDRRARELEYQRRLLREAQATARLSHPNVVTVHDVGTVGGRVFLAMEHIDGITLEDWVEKRSPSFDEVLDAYLEAAEGLAAAHEVGVVHRDFKPQNAMRLESGLVKVVDFGLARPSAVSPLSKEMSESIAEGISEAKRASESDRFPMQQTTDVDEAPVGDHTQDSDAVLPEKYPARTKTGAMIGTPAYMAPEQHMGLPADAKADQFSWCVALWEALCGQRPFEADSRSRLLLAISAGAITEPKDPATMPPWLRTILERGLEGEPGERFDDLRQLLKALREARSATKQRRRIRPAYLAAAGMAVVLGMAGTYLAVSRPEDPCGGGKDRVGGIWNGDVSKQVRQAYAGLGTSQAVRTGEIATDRLDAWTMRWTEAHREVCEATHVRHEQSSELLDRRMACLNAQLDRTATAVDVLSEPDREVVANTFRIMARLGSIDSCLVGDPGELQSFSTDAASDPVVEAELRRGRVLLDAGKPKLAVRSAERASARLAAGDRSLAAAKVSALLADCHDQLGDRDRAAREAERAYHLARELAARELELDAALAIMSIEGVGRDRTEVAQVWERTAEATIEARGLQDTGEQARFLTIRGQVRAKAGDPHGAVESLASAVSLYDQLDDASSYERATALAALANAQHVAGDFEKSIATYTAATQELRAHLGADHPEVARHLLGLGGSQARLGKLDEAIATVAEAGALLERALGADNPESVRAITLHATLLHMAGKSDEAERGFIRALDLLDNEQAVDNGLFMALNNYSALLTERGEYDEALSQFQRGLELTQRAKGLDHPDVATLEANIGVVHGRKGDHDLAREWIEKGLERAERHLGHEHPATVNILAELTDLEQRAGNDLRARQLAARVARACEDANVDRRACAQAEAAGHAAEKPLVAGRKTP